MTTATSSITDLTSPPPTDTKAVLFFWSAWHEATAPNGSTSVLFHALASSVTNNETPVSFYRVEAEVETDLSAKYGITVVPSFVLLDLGGRVVEVIEGADDVAKLTHAVRNLCTAVGPPSAEAKDDSGANMDKTKSSSASPEEILNNRLKQIIQSSQIVLFMKGIPSQPRCGFSRQAIEILTAAKVSFGTFDILSDEEVRQGLKKYSDWPTYPQLYVNGDLVGGLDIMKEMVEDGEDLAEQLGVDKLNHDVIFSSENIAVKSLDDRLKELVNRSKVMLFMKGLPSQPRCGFSRQTVDILNEQGIDFDAFDILSDDEVRQGLKKYSDWPTYPQLYVDGDLVGGLDIIKEMVEGDELKDLIK